MYQIKNLLLKNNIKYITLNLIALNIIKIYDRIKIWSFLKVNVISNEKVLKFEFNRLRSEKSLVIYFMLEVDKKSTKDFQWFKIYFE